MGVSSQTSLLLCTLVGKSGAHSIYIISTSTYAEKEEKFNFDILEKYCTRLDNITSISTGRRGI